jgi:hypothetical protein
MDFEARKGAPVLYEQLPKRCDGRAQAGRFEELYQYATRFDREPVDFRS